MKLFAPKYYKNFSCIADKCSHSCCIGWEIDIDGETDRRYRLFNDGYGKIIKDSIDRSETPHFVLGENERCPHLDEKGLCRIITELGDDCLCEICREHPRFYNTSSLGREVGLGMACEEAARIILLSDEYDAFEEIGEVCGEPCEKELDTVHMREKIYSVLKNGCLSYAEKLEKIYEEFNASPKILSDEAWRSLISELEYLDDSHRELFLHYSSDAHPSEIHEKKAERALAYFVFRHCTAANDEEEYRAILIFCLFLCKLFASVLKVDESVSPETFARIISEEIEYSEDNTERIINEIYFV